MANHQCSSTARFAGAALFAVCGIGGAFAAAQREPSINPATKKFPLPPGEGEGNKIRDLRSYPYPTPSLHSRPKRARGYLIAGLIRVNKNESGRTRADAAA
jgi:hypothetical protein